MTIGLFPAMRLNSTSRSVQFQSNRSAFETVARGLGRALQLSKATPSDAAPIASLLRDFYLEEVGPQSRQIAASGLPEDAAYADQAITILEKHGEVLGLNLARATQNPQSVFHVVKDATTGQVVATAALLNSALGGSFSPPADVQELSYFYQRPDVRTELGTWLLADLSEKARQAGFRSLVSTSRRKGMDDRNQLLEAAGFREVLDPARIAALVPPVLRSPRTVVYEKTL